MSCEQQHDSPVPYLHMKHTHMAIYAGVVTPIKGGLYMQYRMEHSHSFAVSTGFTRSTRLLKVGLFIQTLKIQNKQ